MYDVCMLYDVCMYVCNSNSNVEVIGLPEVSLKPEAEGKI